MKTKLTKSVVDSMIRAGGGVTAWDTANGGFGVRVSPKGRATFFVQKKSPKGREFKSTIGVYGSPWTVNDARNEAIGLLAIISRNEDPNAAKRQGRKEHKEKKNPTFAEFSKRYLTDYAKPRKKARSIQDDEWNLNKHILPAIGKLRIAEIGRADIARFHSGLSKIPYSANRCLALLKTMFNLAELWGERPDNSNPCRGVQMFKELARKRYLDHGELGRIAEAIGKAEGGTEIEVKKEGADADSEEIEKQKVFVKISEQAAAALRLLLLTGCRCGEILSLRWSHVDTDGRCLELPDSKTGAKRVYLNAGAVEILKGLPRDESGWVLPGAREGKPLVNIHKPWDIVCSIAGVEGVRIHDLRHSYAAFAAGLNLGLPIIGKLLGHALPSTTARYAHLMDDPLRAAAESIGAEISDAMAGKGARVIDAARPLDGQTVTAKEKAE